MDEAFQRKIYRRTREFMDVRGQNLVVALEAACFEASTPTVTVKDLRDSMLTWLQQNAIANANGGWDLPAIPPEE